jgi:hypothetical protein
MSLQKADRDYIPENKTGEIIGDSIIPPPPPSSSSTTDSGQRDKTQRKMEQKPEKIQQPTFATTNRDNRTLRKRTRKSATAPRETRRRQGGAAIGS